VTPTSKATTDTRRAVDWLLAPVDIAWLAAFRFLYGLALAVSMWRFIANGWIERFFVDPVFHFKYWGFEWVEPLSGPAMHGLFVVLVALALAMAVGLAFRLAATVFAIGLAYVQLIDVSTYLNHYYLAALLSFLLAASPAARAYSVDAWLRSRGGAAPVLPQVSRAWLLVFRVQVGIVYFFAGLAKAQSDWLLHAQPLSIWLGASTELPILGPLLTLPGVPLVMSWCGFLFDTTVVFFLLFGRTRPWAYAVLIVFHVITRLLFPIGMFPVIMVLGALVFFSPSWPRLLLQRVRRSSVAPAGSGAPGASAALASPPLLARFGLALGAAYCLVQLLLPLRGLAYGGNILWHEQGMRFSWRVMLRAKGGSTTFVVRQRETGRIVHVNPRQYLTGMQETEMSSQPDLIVQLAHHIATDVTEMGFGPVEVFADSRVSLNGRRGVRFIDPKVDLTQVRDGLRLGRIVLPPPVQEPPHTRPIL